jgi:hypothetical protein
VPSGKTKLASIFGSVEGTIGETFTRASKRNAEFRELWIVEAELVDELKRTDQGDKEGLKRLKKGVEGDG